MKRIALTFVALTVFSISSVAKITLPSLMGNGMVLQRNSSVKLWGHTDSKGPVTAVPSWDGSEYTSFPDGNGSWTILVDTPAEGGPYSVSISDGEEIILDNVLIGEVWICSGQSNMEMPVGGWEHQSVNGAFETIMDAGSTPLVRMFTVPRTKAKEPQENCGGEWKNCTPDNLRWFSAAAYYFGKALSRALPGVPIGLIGSYWGGTNIEAWLSEKALEATPGIDQAIARRTGWDGILPAELYNGMIYPLRNYAARGFIWYQGEANLINAKDYPALTVSMVREWRRIWENPEMPYYFVQIAPYRYDDPSDRSLPLLVEQQYRIPDLLPHSAVAPTTDIGHCDCIHPPYKKEVGERLAILALENDYGFNGLPDTPTFRSMTVEKNVARLTFDGVSGAGNSFRIHGPHKQLEPAGFEIAGPDRVWYKAKAVIDWDTNDILVSSPEVPEPVAVRYAFHNWPEGANVATDYGMPLPPFRTDDWKN